MSLGDPAALRGKAARALPLVGGTLSACLGGVVLIGWALGSPGVVQLLPGLTPMQANTAFCFVLLGLALVGLRLRADRPAAVLAAIALTLALLVFSQYLTGLDVGVDRLLGPHAIPTFQSSIPGRMAPNSALALLMAAIAICLLAVRRATFSAALLGCFAFTLGFVALLGFPFGIGRSLAWGVPNQMALHTALGLVLLGSGIVAKAFVRHSETEIGLRRGALLAGVTVALIGLLFWQALRQREEQQIQQFVAQVADGLQREMTKRIRSNVTAVELLSRPDIASSTQTEKAWRRDAELALGAIPEIDSIEWLDARFRPRFLISTESAPRPVREETLGERLGRSALEQARATGAPVVTGPFELDRGAGAIRAFVPLDALDGTRSYLVATVLAAEIFDTLRKNVAAGHDILVRCEDRTIFRSPGFDGAAGYGYAQSRGLSVPGDLAWILEVRPTPELVRRLQSPLPEIALVTCLILAVLLASTFWFGESASLRARQFEAAVAVRTAELRSENEQRRRGEEKLERTLAVSRLVSAEHDLSDIVQAVTDAVRDLTGAGYCAFFYNLVDPSGTAYVLYALSGISREAFDGFEMPRTTALFTPTFLDREVVRCDDVTVDPRYGQNPPHHGQPQDHPMRIVSFLAVPVVSRSGKVWGAMLCGHERPAMFSERDELLALGLASQAATAMDKSEALVAERHARAEAQAANAAKDRFLAVVSHELRNPLGAVRSALEVLDRDTADPTADARMRGILKRQVQQLARLVDDLLDVSRITQGLVQIRTARLDLVALVREIAAAPRPRVESGDLEWQVTLPAGPLWVDADAGRITQALDNVLANAEKFTGTGGRIDLVVEAVDDRALVRVVDTGCGLADDELEHVFEPFEQVGRSLSDGTGLGLGLAIFKGLIEAHGGTVSAASPGIGQGCVFSFGLPLREAPQVTEGDRPAEAPATRRVVLIDDHPDSLEGLGELLAMLGHEVRTAGDGPTGLALARADPPDVIVCDIGLPGMDGYDVAREVRQDPQTAPVRLIALTGFGDAKSVEQARAAGFNHHLTKPVDVNELRRLLALAPTEELKP